MTAVAIFQDYLSSNILYRKGSIISFSVQIITTIAILKIAAAVTIVINSYSVDYIESFLRKVELKKTLRTIKNIILMRFVRAGFKLLKHWQ